MLALSLQDCYVAERALDHPDTLVRVAAIHHTGRRLGQDERLRGLLCGLLGGDGLVARYAALTLAQAGDREGIAWLLESHARSRGDDRKQLESCLRCCTCFPFAVLLTEMMAIESLGRCQDANLRTTLHELLTLSRAAFYACVKQKAAFRSRVINTLARVASDHVLRREVGLVCMSGYIVRAPVGEEAGQLCSSAGGDSATFTEEIVVNRDWLRLGQPVIYTGHRRERDITARRVYAFEDCPPLPPGQLPVRCPACGNTRLAGWPSCGYCGCRRLQ